jgi:hypothetical protein
LRVAVKSPGDRVKRVTHNGAVILLVLAIGIQFIPYGRSHTNPPVIAEPPWDSLGTRELFFKACADCHSNETVWPWYSHIAPVSWLLEWDVTRARGDFNISEWGHSDQSEAGKAAETIQKAGMPPWIYTIPHPKACLSLPEKEELITGLIATFGLKDGDSNNKHGENKHD